MNKVLILFGSPRTQGHTNKIVDLLVSKLDKKYSVNRINLIKKNINHCIGCDKCSEKPYDCIYNDDMTDIYSEIEQSDIIILATPIYFNSVTSITKTFIDRCQRFFNMKVNNKIVFKRKKGVLISTAGSNNEESFDALINISKYFFLAVNAMLVDKILVKNTDKVKLNKEIIEKVNNLGKTL